MKTLVIDNASTREKRSYVRKTMNVGELIEWLGQYPEDMEVRTFWTDGYYNAWAAISKEDFEIEEDD